MFNPKFPNATLIPNQAYTATVDGSPEPVEGYNGVIVYLDVTAASGTSPTLDVKLQDSPDGVNWYDVPSAAFTQATAAGSQRIVVSQIGLFVRAVATIGGTTPSFNFAVTAAGLV